MVFWRRREAELTADLPQPLEQEVALLHPPLHRAEGMLGERLAPGKEGGRSPQLDCHVLQQVLVHPAGELAPLLVARAARRERTATAGSGPIVLDRAASLDGGRAVGEGLPRGTAIHVLRRIVDEVVFGEQPERLVRRGDRSRHQRGEARVETLLDLASRTTERFRKAFAGLSPHVQQRARVPLEGTAWQHQGLAAVGAAGAQASGLPPVGPYAMLELMNRLFSTAPFGVAAGGCPRPRRS